MLSLDDLLVRDGALDIMRSRTAKIFKPRRDHRRRYISHGDVPQPTLRQIEIEDEAKHHLRILKALAPRGKIVQLPERCRSRSRDQRGDIRRDRGYVGQAGPPPGDHDHPAHAAAGSWFHPGATQPHLSSSEKNRSSENARKLCTGEFNSRSEFFPLDFFRGGKLRPERGLR